MLRIKQITNKNTWQSFLDHTYSGFLPFFQTWNWGEVQKMEGIIIERLGLFQDDKLIGVASIALIKAKRGTYFHLRHGPVLKEYKKKHVEYILEYLSKKAKKDKVSFIRMSPLIDSTKELQVFKGYPFRNATIHRMDAEDCWILPLNSSSNEILKNMRKSHRYLIKKSLSTGVRVDRTQNISKLKLFLPLYKKLAQRKHFIAHKGIKEEFEIFSKDNQSTLFLAWYKEKVIAGALIDFVSGMAIYRHSASDEDFKNIPAMYLLQWEVILEAKKRGMNSYNLWGIAPDNKQHHPWIGLTLFKTGFGGERREFMHAKDYVLSLWYWKTYVIELITKFRKGY